MQKVGKTMGFEHVPQELKDRRQWCCWALVPLPEGTIGKPGKIPLQVTNRAIPRSTDRKGHSPDGYHPIARSNDPATWTSFDAASEKSTQLMFGLSEDDPYTVIDLDNLDYAHPLTQEILGHFPGAYVEESPSGTGIHIWVRGLSQDKQQSKIGDRGAGLDIMSRRHFMTVTGKVLEAHGTIPDGEEGLAWLRKKYGRTRTQEKHSGADPHEEVAGDDIDIDYDEDARAPVDKLEKLRTTDKYVRDLWDRTRPLKRDNTPSGYCMALANQLIMHGWTHQETADTLAEYRWRHGDKPTHQGAIAMTIAKAVNLYQSRTPTEKLKAVPQDAPKAARLAVLSHITNLPIVDYVQVGKSPAQYHLYLAGIKEPINLGRAEKARNMDTWLTIAQEYTGTLFGPIDKTTWYQFMNALGAVRTEVESNVNATFAEFVNILSLYKQQVSLAVNSGLTFDCVKDNQPAWHEGTLWLRAEAFTIWARQVHFFFETGQIMNFLKMVQATKQKICRRNGPGQVVSRDYWRIPPHLLTGDDEPEIMAEVEGEPEVEIMGIIDNSDKPEVDAIIDFD